MWFYEILIDLLKAVLLCIAVCAIGALIGSFGFQLRKASVQVKVQGLSTVKWRLLYGVVGIAAGFGGLAAFHLPWLAWLIFAGLVSAGYFGYFMVPEGLGE
jgi:pheromone shutdown protein TraB